MTVTDIQYRVLRKYFSDDESGESAVTIVGVWLDEAGKIVGSTDPDSPFVLVNETSDGLREDIRRIAQAFEAPEIRTSSLPDSPDYVDPDLAEDAKILDESDNVVENSESLPDPSDPGPTEPPADGDVADVVDDDENGGEG